jgi:hypothetical protein
MSSVDILIPTSTRGQSNSTSSNFNQKQAWLEELEKAQKLLHNDNSLLERNIRESVKKNNSNEVFVSELSGAEEIDFQNFEIYNRVKDSNADIKSSTKIIHNPVEIKSSVGSISEFEGSAHGFYFNNAIKNTSYQPDEKNMKLENMRTQFQTNYELQNINLIVGEKGVKIMLRDYRISDKDLTKIIFKIKETLTGIGLEIEKIVVNGSDF